MTDGGKCSGGQLSKVGREDQVGVTFVNGGGFTEKVTLNEGLKEVSKVGIWGKIVLGRGNSQYKGPRAGACLAFVWEE